jgi:uncharacterized protein YqjF (DUF2071 family)
MAVGHQRWNHLLFAHWQVSAATIQATLPPGLFVDTHEGHADVGIVPFYMQRIRPAFLPALPWASWFLELNVRTYIHDQNGQPSVWFYSLDCNRRLAVEIARRGFHLPYHPARMTATQDSATHHYRCLRRGSPGPPAAFARTPGPESAQAEPGSLEFFLIERYVLFSATRGGELREGHVHQQPYRLNGPSAVELSVAPAARAAFGLTGPPDSLLGAAAVDGEIFPLRRIAG